jgi:hypothetical protein
MFKCDFCLYVSVRKYNLQKHIGRKHTEEMCKTVLDKNTKNMLESVQNVPPNVQNVSPNVQNVSPKIQNVPPNVLYCHKCNKIYKTKRHLLKHEINCKGIDELTCPKCMISFSNRKHKSRHINKNNCNARSIVYARSPNTHNITENTIIQNAKTINNNNITNNQIIVNNFGSERMDHITHEDIVKILSSGINTIPMYIQKKHFDKNFPENNNIKYTLENKCKVYENNDWTEKDMGLLSSSLVEDNTEVLLLYCDENDIKLSNDIKDTEKYEHIKNKLILIYNKSENNKYNNILSKIKELIKNSN